MLIIKSDSIFALRDGLAKEFSSPFALEKYEKEKRLFDNQAWRNQDNEEEPGGMFSRSMLWGSRGAKRSPRKPRMRFVQRVESRDYYVLELTKACGLFYYDRTKDEEIRLFHKEHFAPRGIHIAPDHSIVTTTSDEDGSTHIVRLDADGRQVKQLTSGDCIDENPFFSKECIYYQSSGIARTQDGYAALFAPAEIMKLDLANGSVETLKSYEQFDCIMPKIDAEGSLYYIKAPYKSGRVSGVDHFWDILLFPYRLVLAILAFLNVFSIFFAKKPLKTSGGPDLTEDIGKRLMHNRVVDIQQTMRKEGKKVAAPREWKLIRFKNGAEEELATNVLWYDIDSTGKMIYTDGFNVYDAEQKKIYQSDELVTCISS